MWEAKMPKINRKRDLMPHFFSFYLFDRFAVRWITSPFFPLIFFYFFFLILLSYFNNHRQCRACQGLLSFLVTIFCAGYSIDLCWRCNSCVDRKSPRRRHKSCWHRSPAIITQQINLIKFIWVSLIIWK